MSESAEFPKVGKREKKEVLSVFREMWLKGDSPLHRIYSSWEQLEANVEVTSEMTPNEEGIYQPCPNCGKEQPIKKPLDGIFPYQTCNKCKRPFFVNKDLTVRKMTDDEKIEVPRPWIQIVEDLTKKKVAVVLKLE